MIKITEEERNNIIMSLEKKYNRFQVRKSWGLTDELKDCYKEGIEDILDAMVEIFCNQSVYDIATLRNFVMERLEGMDNELL